MIRTNFHLPILLFFLSLVIPSLSMPPLLKIAFPNAVTPTGYQAHDPSQLTPGTQINDISSDPSTPYTTYITRQGGFAYNLNLTPGVYRVKLGFYNPTSANACAKGKRVFTVVANGRYTPSIDLYQTAGCDKSYSRIIYAVKVFDKLSIVTIPVAGLPPILSNVAITRARNLRPNEAKNKRITFVNVGAPLANIHFRDSDPVSGWELPGEGLSQGVEFKSTDDTAAPLVYRSYAEKEGGFVYKKTVQPGKYRVILGFAEINKDACEKGKRVFKVKANRRGTGSLDVFKLTGCQNPVVRALDNVEVFKNGKLTLRFITRFGLPPMISTIRIEKLGQPTNTPNASPSAMDPSPTMASSTSMSPSPAMSSSASPSASLLVSPSPMDNMNPSVKPTVNGTTILSIDAGGSTDVPNSVFGVSKAFKGLVDVTGTSEDSKFSSHRWGGSFTYKVKVPKNNMYVAVLSFAEIYEPNCVTGKRVFSASVYDDATSPADGQTFADIDVFEDAGCKTAHILTSDPVEVGDSGLLAIKFSKKVQQAMVSGIDIVATDPSFTPPPTPTPGSGGTPSPTTDMVIVNVGGPGEIPVPNSNKYFVGPAVSGTGGISSESFKSGRYGFDFTYSFNIAPGAYDIVLGYAETYAPFCSDPGKRVFNVYVNDLIQQEGFDIFAEAGGCFKGLEIKLPEASVSAVETKPLTIRFESTVDNADVKYISVKPAKDVCVPASVTGSTGSDDHAAHSVPGTYPPQINANSAKSYIDSDGDGFVTVQINGDGSHTHFFDPANGIIGQVTDYTWTIVETGEIISKKVAFTYKFPLGTTRLKLAVLDNSCTTDEAETTVTVTSAIQPGQYCYYYDGLVDIPLGGTLLDEPSPQFAIESSGAALGFPSFPFDDKMFAARCFFFLETDADQPEAEVQLTVSGGLARLYKGMDLIVDTDTNPKAKTALPVGLTAFELIYLRKTLTGTPSVNFLVDGNLPAANLISHDRKMILPILTGVTPSDGNPNGGTKVKVSGHGLFSPLTVKFGSKTVPILSNGATRTQFFVESPVADGSASAEIKVTTSADLESNSVVFSYGSVCDNVKFTETFVTKPDGSDFSDVNFPTSAVLGNDGKIYIGTLGATVQVVSYNPKTLIATGQCYGKSNKDSNYLNPKGKPAARDILGIAFNPAENSLSPYVSTATLFWFDKNRIEASNLGAWRNGAIDRFKPGTDPKDPNVCLVYDKRIVTGLPISNHDHSVNGIEFTQNGDLIIAVGGFTNMGLPQYKLGNFWETTLSAAFLIAKLSKGASFDGEIKYSNPDTPRLAQQTGGDVELYATGARNPFGITFTGSGDFYAADQGPNCPFGHTSVACSDYNEAEADTYVWNVNKTWQGSFQFGPPSCPYSVSRPDKILHITPGSWYGHPNIQRGDSECAWIDPFDHLTADDKPPAASYKKPMTTLKSPVTGIAEYRSNHFCGNLRNQLIMSTFKGGKTYNMKVNGGSVVAGPDTLSNTGGITFIEDAHGNLIFPRLSQKNVFAMKPNVSPSSSIFAANAVPFRHGASGGKSIIIGGENFGTSPSVTIGGKPCPVTDSSDENIVCTVPSGTAGALVDLIVTSGGASSTLPDAVLYMNI